MSSPGDVAVGSCEGGVILRLRNPSRRNAISKSMWLSIAAFAREAKLRTDIRYVIVRGDGDVFSAGADISEFKTARGDAGNSRDYDNLVEDTCRLIEAIDKPTIALVVGPCMGAGVSLACSCDLRIASQNAFFSVPAAKIGLGYDPRGIKRLVRLFGPDLTYELIYTGRRLPAQRAWQLGAVSSLVQPESIDDVSMEWARGIASNAPLTIKAAKAAIRAHLTNDAGILSEANRLYSAADASADYAEGLRAFAEKRAPRFVGK